MRKKKSRKELILETPLEKFLYGLYPNIDAESSKAYTKLKSAFIRYYGGEIEKYSKAKVKNILAFRYIDIRKELTQKNRLQWLKYYYGKTSHNRIVDKLIKGGFKEKEFPLLEKV